MALIPLNPTRCKSMSRTGQLNLLKKIRRECPACVNNGSYGYTCGGLKQGTTRYAVGFGSRSAKEHHCTLACGYVMKAAASKGVTITIPMSYLAGI